MSVGTGLRALLMLAAVLFALGAAFGAVFAAPEPWPAETPWFAAQDQPPAPGEGIEQEHSANDGSGMSDETAVVLAIVTIVVFAILGAGLAFWGTRDT
jgi:flagellar basal body-associated protein FliL